MTGQNEMILDHFSGNDFFFLFYTSMADHRSKSNTCIVYTPICTEFTSFSLT